MSDNFLNYAYYWTVDGTYSNGTFNVTGYNDGGAHTGDFYETTSNTTIQVGDSVLIWEPYVSIPLHAIYQGYYLANGVEYPLLSGLYPDNPNADYLLAPQQIYTFEYNFPLAGVQSAPITLAPLDQVNGNENFGCYHAGAAILTNAGEVPVESLKTGDLVATRFGGYRPVKWVGRQSFDPRFLQRRSPHGHSGMPVRIKAGALADQVPLRDLVVSPDHSMLIDGFLVHASDLINGISVVQDHDIEMVHYYHVDLGPHDCVLADGAWSESYAEYNNRNTFHNAAEYYAAYPRSESAYQAMCAEQAVEEHPALPGIIGAVVARLDADRITADPDVHLIADGIRIDPTRDVAGETQFTLTLPVRRLQVASRAVRPLSVGLGLDRRRLGYSVAGIRLRDAQGEERRLDMADSRLFGEGFHPVDAAGFRWTDGSAALHLSTVCAVQGEATLIISGHGVGKYFCTDGATPIAQVSTAPHIPHAGLAA